MSAAADLYEQLIAPIADRMMATVARIVHDPDEAADTFQEVLAHIWANLRRIHGHPNPHAYILRVCISLSYETLRRRSRRRNREAPLEGHAESASHPGASPAAALEHQERERRILDAVAALPRMQAQAVLLRLVEGVSFPSVAETLGCGEATARSHVSKGRARLRQLLSDLL